MNSNETGGMLSARLLPVGDTAWTVEFGSVIDPALHARVLGLTEAIERARSEAAFGTPSSTSCRPFAR